MKSHVIALSSFPSLSFPWKRGSRATGITFTLHGISVCKILFVTLVSRFHAQLSGENHEIRKQRSFHLKAIISAPFSLTPAPSIVIPAKAGTQGPMRHIAGVMAFPLTRSCRLPWAPASAGVTRVEIGYFLHNQVLRAAFSLETLTHYVLRKIFFIFPRTTLRFRGNDNEWKENDIGGGRDRTVGNRVFGLKVIGCTLLTLLLHTTNALAAIMPTTANGSIPSHAQLSTLCSARKVQEGILSTRATIMDILEIAEGSAATNQGVYVRDDFNISNHLTPGIHANGITGNGQDGEIDPDDGVIIFTLTPSDVHSQAAFADSQIILTYTPVRNPNNWAEIIGWACGSTAGHLNYSPSWNSNPNETSKDPITVGLGYPFYGCTYDPIET